MSSVHAATGADAIAVEGAQPGVAGPAMERFIAESAAAILDACTRCGHCVQACPVVPLAGLGASDPRHIVAGVLDTLRTGEPLAGDSATWVHQCNGCGACIPVCPDGVNPRRMVMLASSRHAQRDSATPQLFRKMARAIRTMAAMQLVPEDVARLLRPVTAREADVVFYLGCNAIRTPHILLNAAQVLDALDVDYELVGGPSACCGIIHTKWEGELQTGGKVTEVTLQRFGEFTPKKVLNWCPSCELHLGETVRGYRSMSFDFEHLTGYLVECEAALRARLVHPVPMRVLLHVHEGMAELGRNVERLLRAIPGLTVVDTVAEAGYTCGGSGADRSPALKAKLRDVTLARMREPGIDALVSLFHGCHMQLAAAGHAQGFEVVNFTDLLVRGLGRTPRADALEPLRIDGDPAAFAREVSPHLRANGIDLDEHELAALLPDLMSLAEFRGGLAQFAAGSRAAAGGARAECG